MWSNAVGCCEFHFYVYVIMNFSVCFLEKVKIWYAFIALFIFILSLMWNIFFLQSTQFIGIVWSWHGDSWANADLCPWQKRDFHQRSSPSLSSRRSSSFTASKHNLFYFTGDLASFWTTSVIASVRCYTPAVTHHVIMPRYPTIDLFS